MIPLRQYLTLARPDHWIKNVFMLPGVALAIVVDDTIGSIAWAPVLLGIVVTCLVASANYTINEYLDREFDKHHPTKSKRMSVQGRINGNFVLGQYAILAFAGLFVAAQLNPVFIFAIILLLFMGILYNVPPIRTKDRVYIDVLSESVNNPIRLVLGWASVTTIALPPSSLLLSYWMGGAFLMATKRFAEYRMIDDPERAGRYRKSFVSYNENRLSLSSFFYALTAVFFLGIFLIKYKIEFVLSFPFIALLFTWYQHIALRPQSSALNPEKLYREPKFVFYVISLAVLVLTLFFVEIPILQPLMDHSVVKDIRIE